MTCGVSFPRSGRPAGAVRHLLLPLSATSVTNGNGNGNGNGVLIVRLQQSTKKEEVHVRLDSCRINIIPACLLKAAQAFSPPLKSWLSSDAKDSGDVQPKYDCAYSKDWQASFAKLEIMFFAKPDDPKSAVLCAMVNN